MYQYSRVSIEITIFCHLIILTTWIYWSHKLLPYLPFVVEAWGVFCDHFEQTTWVIKQNCTVTPNFHLRCIVLPGSTSTWNWAEALGPDTGTWISMSTYSSDPVDMLSPSWCLVCTIDCFKLGVFPFPVAIPQGDTLAPESMLIG